MNEHEDTLSLIAKKLEDDNKVPETTEPDYLLTLSSKISRWQSLYSKKLREFKKLESELDSKYKELYLYYQFEFEVKLDKKELNIFINADSEYRLIKNELNDTECQLTLIQDGIKNLMGQSYNLKHRLDYMRLMGFVDG